MNATHSPMEHTNANRSAVRPKTQASAPSAPSPAPASIPAGGPLAAAFGETYTQLTRTVERLHRRFLDVLRSEITRLGIHDINAVQALMLCNLDGKELAVRDLVERGYYLGSNVSYNLKQLAETGYCEQERSTRDKRSRRIVLTKKGRDLCEKLAEVEKRHAAALFANCASKEDPDVALRILRQLESNWSDSLRYQDV